GVTKFGICSEELMPYKSATATGLPSKAALENAKKCQHVTSFWIHDWKEKSYGFNDAEIDAICKYISGGQPVSCATRWPKGGGWSTFSPKFTMNNKEFPAAMPGHIVVLVGYERGSQWEGG